MSISNIYRIVFDSLSNKWFGTLGNGFVKFDGSKWTAFNTYNSQIPENIIRALAISRSGIIWIGTSTKGLVRFDGKKLDNLKHI